MAADDKKEGSVGTMFASSKNRFNGAPTLIARLGLVLDLAWTSWIRALWDVKFCTYTIEDFPGSSSNR